VGYAVCGWTKVRRACFLRCDPEGVERVHPTGSPS
jgi:hypothetical protein